LRQAWGFESWLSDSQILLMFKNKFLPHFLYFLADLVETEHKKVPAWCHWEAESCLKMGAVKAIFYSRVLMYFWLLFFYLMADFSEIRFWRSAYNAFEQLQVPWKLVQKSCTYLYGLKWNFAYIFYIFHSTLIQSIVEQLHIMVSEVVSFVKMAQLKAYFISWCKWFSVHTFVCLLFNLDEIWCNGFARSAVEHFWVPWKLEDSLYFYGHEWNSIYKCTVKLYDILKVKNTLMMSVYRVTEYIICSLVVFMFCYILYYWLINDKVYE
jgi:hypothetical protein